MAGNGSAQTDQLAEHMPAVARALFGDPNPQQSKPGKPRWGRNGSLAIDETRGVWFDHENETGGGVIDLIKREKGLTGRDAIEWIKSLGCPVDAAKPNGSTRSVQKPAKPAKKLLATYTYNDEDGALVFQVLRYGFLNADGLLVLAKTGKPQKTFYQRRPDRDGWIWGLAAGEYMRTGPGKDFYRFNSERWDRLPSTKERRSIAAPAKMVPYRLPELLEAVSLSRTIFIVEGEHKADALAKLNLCATCNAEGAGKWTAEHAAHLRGADVVILPDNDVPGHKHAEAVAKSLQGVAARIRILELPKLMDKQDIVDWLGAGHTREELDAVIDQTPECKYATRINSQDPVSNSRGLVVRRASEVEIEPIEWLWRGRIAIGKQTLLAGEAGLGKSQVSIAMTAAVSTAGSWPCGEGHAVLGNVIILSAEDGAADTVVPRLMAAGAELTRVHIISAVRAEDGKGHRAFNLQADLDLLEQKITELGDVRLVIIDPISSYMGPKVDSHVNAAVRGVLEPIGEMAARLRVAIVSITHPPKGTGTAAINRFIGSVAFVAAARSAFMVARDADDNDRRLFLPVKNNLAPLGNGLAFRLEQRIVGPSKKGVVASAVAWDNNPVNVSADEALRATDDSNTSDHTAKDEAIEFLRVVLAPGPIKVADIEREAHEARLLGDGQLLSQSKPFRSARKALGVITSKGGMGDGWIWSLPKMP